MAAAVATDPALSVRHADQTAGPEPADAFPLKLTSGRFQATIRQGSTSAQFVAELPDDAAWAEAFAQHYQQRLEAVTHEHFAAAVKDYQRGERHAKLTTLRDRIASLHKTATEAQAARDVAEQEWRDSLSETGKPKDPEPARRRHEAAARQHAEAADLLKGMEADAHTHLHSVLETARARLAAVAAADRQRLIKELLAAVSARLLDLEISAAILRLTPEQVNSRFGAA